MCHAATRTMLAACLRQQTASLQFVPHYCLYQILLLYEFEKIEGIMLIFFGPDLIIFLKPKIQVNMQNSR